MSRGIRRSAVVALAAAAAMTTVAGYAAAAGGTVTGDKTVGTTDITCGGSVPVTVTLNAMDGIAGNPTDIELVLDRSGSMSGQPFTDLKAGAKTFVDIIDEATDGSLDGVIANGSRVGVVSFANTASPTHALSGDATSIKAAIDALVAGGATNHQDAFDDAQAELAGSQPANSKKMIMFTDGQTTAGGNPDTAAANARAAGTEIFAIGLGGVDVAALNNWATDPDSSHVFVTPSSSELEAIFAAIGAAIVVPAATDVSVVDTVAPQFSVSGAAVSKGSVAQAGNQLTWTIDSLRTESATMTFTATHLPAAGGGAIAINPTVVYSDAEGHSVAFPNPTVNVHGCAANIDVEPEHEVNELGTPGQTHTVTGTVTDDFGDPVAGVSVDYAILSGPNAGGAGSDVTVADGTSDHTYAAVQGLAGLGTDSIRGCFTTAGGVLKCDDVLKDWVDTTPPTVSCTPTNNPGGGTIPPAANEDGFYQLNATDAVDPNPQLYVADDASTAVFGGFPDGTKIKLVQAPGATPNQRPGAGDIDWKITLKGDALVTAVDASGNVSAPVSCRVPPPPK